MIDLIEYKHAIRWLQRSMAEQKREPGSQILRDGLLHSFEVTYNVTESILRQMVAKLSDDAGVAYLSSRELMRTAMDEGVTLTSGEAWLRYGLAIERATATFGEEFSEYVLPLLPQYSLELESFAVRLEGRLEPNA